jgi:hypothetical protein
LRLKDKIGMGEVELAEISLLLDLCAEDEDRAAMGGLVPPAAVQNGYILEDASQFYITEDASAIYITES